MRWEERLGVAVRWEEADWGRARGRDGGANEERVRVPEGGPRDRFEPSDRSHSSFG